MKLHIGNLPKSVTDTELSALVVAIAKPTSLELVKDATTGVSKGYAFAEFATDEEARAVMSGLNGKEVGGQTLKLGEARPRKGDARPAPATPQV
jgi:RNA recognition motif-containing protein